MSCPRISAAGFFSVGFYLIPTVTNLITFKQFWSIERFHWFISVDWNDVDVPAGFTTADLVRKYKKLLDVNGSCTICDVDMIVFEFKIYVIIFDDLTWALYSFMFCLISITDRL